MEIAPNTMHLDMPTVQHGTVTATTVVTLGTVSKSAEEVPLPTNRIGKHNTLRKAKSTTGRRDILMSLGWKNSMAKMMKMMYTLLGLTLMWLVIQMKS